MPHDVPGEDAGDAAQDRLRVLELLEQRRITAAEASELLAALGDRRLKATRKELHDALHGRLTEHHRFLLKLHLDQHDALEKTIRVIDAEVERRIARLDKQAKPAETPLSRLIELLVSIPGVSYLSAITIISEIGSNMSRFPTAGHLIAWAGLCPGQNESAGKRKRSRLRKGAPWLKTMRSGGGSAPGSGADGARLLPGRGDP